MSNTIQLVDVHTWIISTKPKTRNGHMLCANIQKCLSQTNRRVSPIRHFSSAIYSTKVAFSREDMMLKVRFIVTHCYQNQQAELNLECNMTVLPYFDLNHTYTSTGLNKYYTGVILWIFPVIRGLLPQKGWHFRLTYEIECIEKVSCYYVRASR